MEYYDPRDYDLAGRIAKLKTLHGIIEAPYLFPVIDPLRQIPRLEDIAKIGFNAFITNAYLFYRRNKGVAKDIHDFFHWKKPIMTDSGGYQILLYGSVEISNKEIVEYEKSIGTDIAVILDIPTGSKMSINEVWDAVHETIRRAWEALPLIMDSKQLWVLPIQGAPYIEPLLYSAKISSTTPYHIYALGSPTVYLEKYAYEDILEFTILARINLPAEKPLHVFGVGHPMIIPFLVAVGADLFDSASYILYARDERLMFEWGTRRLDELQYLPCNCPVCTKYSVEELRSLSKRQRVELIALHNLYVLKKELDHVKQAIKDGRLWEYLEYRSKAHPMLRKAFNVIKKYRGYLEKYNPYTKASGQAILLINNDSVYHPRLEMNKKITYQVLTGITIKKLLLVPAISKPFNQDSVFTEFKKKYETFKILFYHPYLGLFPPELVNTFPYFQHEIGEIALNRKIVKEIVDKIRELRPSEVLIVKIDKPVYAELAEDLVRDLKDKIAKVNVIHA